MGRYSSLEFSKNGNINPLNQYRSELQRVQWFIKDYQLVRGTIDQIDAGTSSQWRTRTYMNDIKELNVTYINQTGLQSRSWPIANNISPLHTILFNIALPDGTSLNYVLRPLL